MIRKFSALLFRVRYYFHEICILHIITFSVTHFGSWRLTFCCAILWILYFEYSFCCEILQILDILSLLCLEILGILDPADLGSCRSWILKLSLIVRSWRSWTLIFSVIAVGSWRSWILNLCFVVRSWRSWILTK